jgi:hypothetical protein
MAPLVGFALAGLAGCGSSSDVKVGGAWPSHPVKCSAYTHDRAQYEACLERDREATAPAPKRPQREA